MKQGRQGLERETAEDSETVAGGRTADAVLKKGSDPTLKGRAFRCLSRSTTRVSLWDDAALRCPSSPCALQLIFAWRPSCAWLRSFFAAGLRLAAFFLPTFFLATFFFATFFFATFFLATFFLAAFFLAGLFSRLFFSRLFSSRPSFWPVVFSRPYASLPSFSPPSFWQTSF